MKHGWVFLGVAVLVGASQAFAETATAVIQPTGEKAKASGTATLSDTPNGLKVTVQVANAPQGKHGIHVHQFGNCGEKGNAAGGHFNPDGVKHGHLPKDGFLEAHAGDLGNIEINKDGKGTLSLLIPGLTVAGGKYTVAGRSIVLHEKPDDFGQPTGNAGGRIGCGPIVITSE